MKYAICLISLKIPRKFKISLPLVLVNRQRRSFNLVAFSIKKR